MDDLSLIQATLRGDIDSFAGIVTKYKGMIFNLIYRLTGNPGEAEDLSQESFLRAYKNLSQFNMSQEFKNWLYTVAVNVCRSRFRRKRIFFLSINRAIDGEETEWASLLGDDNDNPEKKLIQKENERRARKMIGCLPFKYRAVFVLRYIEDRSYQEIAEITEIPLGTVKTFLFRGQKILSDKISDETFFGEKE